MDAKHLQAAVSKAIVNQILTTKNPFPGMNPWLHRKWSDVLNAGINLVEIDLVRGGKHSIQLKESLLPDPPGTFHWCCVNRSILPDRRELYPCPWRERLPAIRIPLRPTDPDIPLDLQPLIDRVDEMSRYWRSKWLDPLVPPLAEEDAGWATECLTSAGLLP